MSRLIIIKETISTGRVESLYKSRLKAALMTDTSLFDFDISARAVMNSINTGNHLRMDGLYKVDLNKDNVEVWHLNNAGEKDRLIMRVILMQ